MDSNASFEDEIQSLNPNYDLIFSKCDESRLNLSPPSWEPPLKHSPRKMQIISKMNNIIGIKPVGELPSHKDWEETECVEKETIALMRTLGLEQSIDQAPDEGRTISTVPTNDDVIIMRNGHKKMSVFMSNSYFQLKPRSEPSFDTDEENDPSSKESTTSDFSDGGYMYVPIELNTTSETEKTAVLEDSKKQTENKQCRRADNKVDLSWRRRSPLPEVTQQLGNSKRRSHQATDSNNGNSSSSSSGSSWWRSGNSGSDTKNDNNWRHGSKPAEIQKKESEIVVKPKPILVSNCGSPLYKPKELFMRRRTEMIQKVLAANKS